MDYSALHNQTNVLPQHFALPVPGSQAPAAQGAPLLEIPLQGILPSELPPGMTITKVDKPQSVVQILLPNPREPPAQMPAWLASFMEVLTGLSNRLQFVAPDNHPPHPPHHSHPPPGEQENEQEQVTSPDDGIDVQSPKEDENNNSHKFKKSPKRSEKSRSNIKLTRDADISEDEGSYISEHTQRSKRPHLSELDQLPLTLLDGKGFMYATLGSGLASLPSVVTEVREPGNLHDRTTSSPDLSQFPPAVVVAKALTRHNCYLQGLDKLTKPSDVDCSSKRLQDIQVDHDVSTKGFSMSKQKCKGLHMHSTDLVIDRPSTNSPTAHGHPAPVGRGGKVQSCNPWHHVYERVLHGCHPPPCGGSKVVFRGS